MKKIGIITTGGDCSGLNSVIFRLVDGGLHRGHKMFGVLDGTDGLAADRAPKVESEVMEFTPDTLPAAYARMSGSMLRNGRPGAEPRKPNFQKNIKKNLAALGLDAVVLIGGNGSISLAKINPDVYSSVQLICIPKTIDMDIPLTDKTVGFDTAVNELAKYADQLLLTARSHHRWFVIQTMGRDSGFLCLHAGLAAGASAILIPEVKWKLPELVRFIAAKCRDGADYGLIFAAEGCRVRGRSGKVADIIARDLEAAGISARAEFPEHLQRSGDTAASDRILAAEYANAALNAIENNETFVMTAKRGGEIKTIDLAEITDAGVHIPDPNVPGMFVSNEYVSPDNPLIRVAAESGIFI